MRTPTTPAKTDPLCNPIRIYRWEWGLIVRTDDCDMTEMADRTCSKVIENRNVIRNI